MNAALSKICFVVMLLALEPAPLAFASADSTVADAGSAQTDTADTETRTNPILGNEDQASQVSRRYPFIHYKANYIKLNGADWSGLRLALHNAAQGHGIASIAHIGDSHIQAEGNTSRIRRQMQQKYGNAGRGLITPFRLAGTNQPTDYRITSPSTFAAAKLMRLPWTTTMGFTGISLPISSTATTFDIHNSDTFDTIIVYGQGKIAITKIEAGGQAIGFEGLAGDNFFSAALSDATTACTITLSAPGGNIFGFELRYGNKGVRYHAIGNNGATFAQYNGIPGFGSAIQQLSPDLVIISLGTNEAFGKTTDEAFTRQIDAMVNDVRTHNPEAQILLTTPAECQRSIYTTKRTRRRRGRKARTRRIRTYAVNTNIARLRTAILRYGESHNIAIWDWYDVAGGDGASSLWLSAHLLGGDRIHRTWTGYHLEGDLLAEALDNAISGTMPSTQVASTPANTASQEAPSADKASTAQPSAKKKATAKKSAAKYNTKKAPKAKSYNKRSKKRKKRRR